MRPATAKGRKRVPDDGDHAWLADAVRAHVRDAILPRLDSRVTEVALFGLSSPTFSAAVTSTDLKRFEITLHDGCLALILEALDHARHGAMPALVESGIPLLGEDAPYDLICRVFAHVAVAFVLLHEYAHIVAGHLHALAEPGRGSGGVRTLRVDEAPASRAPPAFRLGVSGLSPTDINRVFELEADATAYEILIPFAQEILLAHEGVTDLLPMRDGVLALGADQADHLQRIAFYACALAVALTERTRAAAGCARVYPSALARTMNLCLILLRHRLPGDWAYEDGHQTAQITEAGEAAIREVIAPTMAAATRLCAAACTHVGLGAGSIGRAGSQGRFRSGVARDIALLARDSTARMTTAAGRDLVGLQVTRLRLLDAMRPLRQASWWGPYRTT